MADEETPETTDQEPDAVTEEPQAEAAAEPVDDTAGEEAAPAEPVEQVAPKERRRREKAAAATATGPRPSLSPEERQAARAEARAANGAERRRRHATVRQRAQARASTAVAEPAPAVEPTVPGQAKVRQGVVISDKADKTITIRIDAARRHRRYKKVVRSTSSIHAHDERNEAHEGDTVRVIESRPLSRTKRWRLVEILERAK